MGSLPSSGELGLEEIYEAIYDATHSTQELSIETMSRYVGFLEPHKISDFYGFDNTTGNDYIRLNPSGILMDANATLSPVTVFVYCTDQTTSWQVDNTTVPSWVTLSGDTSKTGDGSFNVDFDVNTGSYRSFPVRIYSSGFEFYLWLEQEGV